MINFLDDLRDAKGGKPFKSVPIKISLGKWTRKFQLSWPRAPRFLVGIAHHDFGGISIGSRHVAFRVYYPTAGFDLDWRQVNRFLDLNVFRSARSLTGVDIGADSIKAVALRYDGRRYHLKACDTMPLPPECIVDGAINNFPRVTEALKAFVDDRFSRRVALGISGHSVIIKRISLPEMSQAELDASILWEAEQYIPFDIKEVYIGCQILDPHAGQGQMDVLLCAVKRDIVNDYLHVAREAGLDPVAVSVNTQALEQAYFLSQPEEVSKSLTVALVDVGASMTSVAILVDGRQAFSRDIGMGGSLLTEGIQRRFSVSWEEAKDFHENEDDVDISDLTREQVLVETKRVAGTLATEIQRSIEFYKATSVGEIIRYVYITGGMGQSEELRRVLERRLEVPVQLMNPFQGIEVDPVKFDVAALTAHRAKFAVAIGLALGQS